ncbi:hypothetical protein JCM31598_39180 [Desulfonatronum parangueonense]
MMRQSGESWNPVLARVFRGCAELHHNDILMLQSTPLIVYHLDHGGARGTYSVKPSSFPFVPRVPRGE